MTGNSWFARSGDASTPLATAAMLVLIGCAWHGTETSGAIAWMAATIAATITGCFALGWLRAARVGFTAPQIMLLLGAAGMVCGLAYDTRMGGLDALTSRCLAGAGDFLGTLRLHWQMLPAMHLGMIAGGLATVALLRIFRHGCRRQFCARLVQNLACSGWMVLGMAAGTLFFVRLAAWSGGRSSAAMLGGMFGGMVWGMVASVATYRLWFWARDRHAHQAVEETD